MRHIHRAVSRFLMGGLAVVWVVGCASTGNVTPLGNDTFAISVQGTESSADTAESLKDKLRGQFQAKAQQITDGKKYERYELISFDVAREQKNGVTVPYGRGTIHCIR
jgi:hypothetical protein